MTVRQEAQVDARSSRGRRPLRVAVLGLGPRWRKRYGPALEGMRDLFHIQAVCDPIQEWADHEARRLGCAAAAGPTELLELDDIDGLLLLEAPWYRLWPLELACRLGKPAFCAALPDETDPHVDELLRQVKERRLLVMTALAIPLAPASDRLQQLLHERLGPARLLLCNVTQPRRLSLPSGALLTWCAALLGSEPIRVLHSEVPSAGVASALLEFTEGRALQITQRRVPKSRGSVQLHIVAEHGEATVALPRRLRWSDAAGRHTLTLPRPVPVARRLLECFHLAVTTGQSAEPNMEQAHRPLPWLRPWPAVGRKDGGSKLRIANCGLRIENAFQSAIRNLQLKGRTMRARLSVEGGTCTPSDFELFAGPAVTLGRDPANAIIVHDERASRRHAEVVHVEGRWIIHNVGNPRNGTLLNGRRITGPTTLENGHEIRIGDARLRFHLPTLPEPKPAPLDDAPGFHVGELSALCEFMTEAPREIDPRLLIRRALETALQQTQATFVGFLSLDANQPLPRLVLPEEAPLDTPLSRQLTKEVQRTGQSMWLSGPRNVVPGSGSLEAFTDAICLPLTSEDRALGALHLYKVNDLFTERHLRFGEALAGSLSASLALLRVRRSLEADNARLRGRAPAADDLIGSSPAMQQLRDRITRAAARPATVLIRGESGVGKELVALALHRQGPRRDAPLVVVNCAALAPTLLEAELFGHRKGAFTGADRDRPGLFEQADEGTLFLDEVGELSPACQAKLLRVIEGKGFRPVGATADVQVDVRILAATHRDLESEARKGDFRQDLFYRLQVIALAVPPLREHAEDVPELTAHYLQRLAVECRRPVRLTDAALRRLQSYAWPGNVRQLWAVLESAATMSDGPLLDACDLPLPGDAPGTGPPGVNLEELETWAIREALLQTKGQLTRAAALLGIGRDTLRNKMKKKGIDGKGP